LALEAQTHVEVMEIIVLLCFTVQRETIRAKNILQPRMTE
jgi:hypothetical protein